MVYSLNLNPPILPKLGQPKAGILLKNLNFCYNVRPIHSYSRIFGMTPFSIIPGLSGEPYEARVKIFDFVWFIVSTCAYVILGIGYLQTLGVQLNPNESYILVYMDTLLISFGVLFGAIIIVLDMLNRFRIIEILEKFMLFDKRVRKTILERYHLTTVKFYSIDPIIRSRLQNWVCSLTIRKVIEEFCSGTSRF